MKLSWNRLALVRVTAKPAGLWHPAVEYIAGPRLLRFQVVAADQNGGGVPTVWHPCTGAESTADGINGKDPRSGSLLTSTARRGALIAKIGGGTADIPDSNSPAVPYSNKRVFAVGSQCVVFVAANDSGTLFLTMNDAPEGFDQHDGALHVSIDEYPL